MPRLHVSPLSRIEEVTRKTGAKSLVTLLSPGTKVSRPAEIEADRHLNLGVSDIVEPALGQVFPETHHIDQLLHFFRRWDRSAPMLIHCFAGVSRSTASAFIAACALNPKRDEHEIAQALRAASPTASPNSRFVALADEKLQRDGRMVVAIQAIGRGADCFEAEPFTLEL